MLFLSYRFSKKHLILGGLWYGKEKPFMLTYLQPIVDQINALCSEGMSYMYIENNT